MMRPLPVCECNPRCSCSLVSKIRKEREDDCVIRFLDGLNNEYDSVKSGVLVLDPIPAVDKVFKMALKMERKLNGSSSHTNNEPVQASSTQGSGQQNDEEENMIAASGFNGSINNYNKKYANNGENVPKCTFCGMTGHTIDKWYKKHGYPPGWVPGYKNKARQNQNVQQGTNVQNASVNHVADIGLTSEQFQRLVSLLHNQNGQASPSTAAVAFNSPSLRSDFKKSGENSNEGRLITSYSINYVLNDSTVWILDSGANDHIYCSLDYFDNCHTSQGAFVNLSNGQTAKVSQYGNIRLNESVWYSG